jgi:hypothetical protein
MYVPPQPVPQPAPQPQPGQRAPQSAPPGPPRNEGRAGDRGRDHWLDDLTLYENDDPVPAPMSLAPVSVYDSPDDVLVPPAPARPQPRGGSPGPGRRPFTRDVPHPLEPQGRLEPIPDERFRFSAERPAADLMFTMKPGELAPGHSPLYEHVSMRDFENIAPGAVPVVVAVRHPGICPFPCRCHRDQVAFVQVWAPDRRARKVKVERHGTEVKLDYGSHEVRVRSRDGRIDVEYDD